MFLLNSSSIPSLKTLFCQRFNNCTGTICETFVLLAILNLSLNKQMNRIFFTAFFSMSIILFSTAQDKGYFKEIKPIEAKGEVIGTLEGMDNIAIVQITKADTANADFKIDNQEILCTFQWGTKPRENDPKLKGVKKGDIIRMELSGSRSNEHSPWDYVVFRYWVIKEGPSSAEDAKPQK